jgi:predicted nucleic acid-binding protein
MMNTGAFFPDYHAIDRSLEEAVEDIPPQLFSYLSLQFQRNISEALGKNVGLDLKLVVDTSSLISELISFVKVGKSMLYEVTKGPFILLYAPSKLIEEVEEKIPKIARNHKLEQNSLIQAWRQVFLPRIAISDTNNLLASLFGYATVGKRDTEDVPFVALTFSLQTHGILTRDKDIIEQPQIRTWKMGKVKKFVTVFKKGTFSFFVSANLLVPLFRAIFQIGVVILRSLLEFAGKVIEAGANLVRGFIDGLSKLPDWAKLLFGLAIVALLTIEETRKKAIEVVQKIGEAISAFLSQMYNLLRQLLEQLAPYVGFALNAFSVLFNSISEATAQLQAMQSM